MTQNQKIIIAFTFLILLSVLTWWASPAQPFEQSGAWYSILPAMLAVILAFATHRLIPSLLIAIFLGGLLSTLNSEQGFSLLTGVSTAAGYGFEAITDSWNLKVLAFVMVILSMISVMIISGGLVGVVNRLLRFAQRRRSTLGVTYLMGLVVFIDDYANTMIVGSSMRPVTDQHRVSREKLAFIIDATSAPVAGLAVISTWIGFEVGLFGKVSEGLGIGVDGYSMFFDAVQFRFYCILMLLFVLLNIYFSRDYGPMLRAEQRAIRTGKLLDDRATPSVSGGFALVEAEPYAFMRARNAVIPVIVLFTILLGGLWIDGGGGAKLGEGYSRLFSITSWREVISNAKNNTLILLLASLGGLFTATALAVFDAKVNWEAVQKALLNGVKSSAMPVMILIMAWSLKANCDDLNTGEFLVATIGNAVSPLLFPALLFLAAALTSFGTGTSWGTMAILIPTAIPVAFQLDGGTYGLITMISLGAVLDGAIFGDHCSPISDTTIMSSIASASDHLDHVRTQLPYALSIGALALVCGYLPSAMGMDSMWSYLLGVILILLLLLKLGKPIHE